MRTPSLRARLSEVPQCLEPGRAICPWTPSPAGFPILFLDAARPGSADFPGKVNYWLLCYWPFSLSTRGLGPLGCLTFLLCNPAELNALLAGRPSSLCSSLSEPMMVRVLGYFCPVGGHERACADTQAGLSFSSWLCS